MIIIKRKEVKVKKTSSIKKPEVTTAWVNVQCAEILSEIVDHGAGNLGILRCLQLFLPVVLKEAGVEVKET